MSGDASFLLDSIYAFTTKLGFGGKWCGILDGMAESNWVRPYWHVDVKWVFGILFSVSGAAALLLFVLATLTSPKVAIPVASYVVASQFSRDGLNDARDIEAFKRQMAGSAQPVFYPLGGKDVSITRQELESLEPREIRLKIFRQVVEPIYLTPRTPETMKQYGVLAFLNQEMAQKIATIFYASLPVPALALLGLVWFSRGLGRLVSPSVPILLFVTPVAFLLVIVQYAPLPEGDGGLLSALPRELIGEIAASLSWPFYVLWLVAAALLLAAFVGKLVARRKK